MVNPQYLHVTFYICLEITPTFQVMYFCTVASISVRLQVKNES